MSFESTEGIASAMMQLVNDHGGASAMMQQFQSGGMGSVASSWTTTSQPVNPDQLGSALNPQTVDSVAQQHGVSSQELLQMASQYLPQLIGHMSSTGQDQAPSGIMGTLLHLFQR